MMDFCEIWGMGRLWTTESTVSE